MRACMLQCRLRAARERESAFVDVWRAAVAWWEVAFFKKKRKKRVKLSSFFFNVEGGL